MTFSELKKRLIFRVGVAYLTIAWLVIQIIGTLTPIYNLPGILVQGFAFMLILGYPLIMLLTLVFEMTHKTRGWEAVEEENRKNALSDKIFYSVIFGLLGLTITILLVDIFLIDTDAESQTRSAGVPLDQVLKLVPVADTDTAQVPEKSIAVLPFTDLSENGDQEYFSDGLSNDLINRLAMMPDLQVAGRESSFYYKGRDEVLSGIGEALQVENILLGSVRKSGDQLRVTAQLVSADDGFNIWSRTYDRELADVFAIQSEIVDEVATALSVTLGAGEFDAPGMTRNISAYDKTLQAMALYNQFTPDNVFRAINLLEEAVREDATYGRGWLLLGTIYNESQLILSADQAMDFPVQVARAFGQAATNAPDMPELMLVEADSMRDNGLYQEARDLYERYFDNYGYSSARAMEGYAQLLSRTGRFNEAIAMLDRARRQNPLVPRYTYQLALHELYRGQVDKVQALAEYGLGLEGGEFLFSSIAWQVAMHDGDLDKAARLIRDYYTDNPEDSYDATVSRRFMEKVADILARNDFERSAEDIIELINDSSITPLELGYMARVVALMDQPEIALDYWYGEEASPAIWDRIYDSMRRLPQFHEYLEDKGLVAYWRTTGDWGDFCVPAGGLDFVCK